MPGIMALLSALTVEEIVNIVVIIHCSGWALALLF